MYLYSAHVWEFKALYKINIEKLWTRIKLSSKNNKKWLPP